MLEMLSGRAAMYSNKIILVLIYEYQYSEADAAQSTVPAGRRCAA